MPQPRTDLMAERIVLRPNSPEFAPHLCEASRTSLATVGRWMSWCHPAFSEAEAREWYHACLKNWDCGAEYEFSIFNVAGAYIGAAGLNQINQQHNFANLGYWVCAGQQGRGYAAEAAKLLATFGFNKLGLNRIEVVVAESNAPSRRVAEKCGASFEGVLRNRLLIHGSLFPAAMYSLLPEVGPNPSLNPDAHRQAFSPPAVAG